MNTKRKVTVLAGIVLLTVLAKGLIGHRSGPGAETATDGVSEDG